MFCPLPYRDVVVVFRALLILVVVIVLGVSVSEQQLNSLTQRQEGVRAFNIRDDDRGVYSIDILGSSYRMSAVYIVGEIINHDKTINIKSGHHLVSMPTYIEIDCKQELIVLDIWANLLIEKGFDFKKSLALYLTGVTQKLTIYIGHFR